jgi:hypothetical protein
MDHFQAGWQPSARATWVDYAFLDNSKMWGVLQRARGRVPDLYAQAKSRPPD